MGVRIAFVTAALAVVSAGCSSSSSHPAGETSAATPSGSSTRIVTAAQYVDAVNALCDDLLSKILKVIHGGHPGVYPVAEFMSELPAHSKLERDFDKQLARIPVPAAARSQSAALHAYIAYANKIDAERLKAARTSQKAFDKVIRAENKEAPNDPVIAARDAAGFNESCNAR
jgi:hypothetical protein